MITIDWANKVIQVPKTYMSLIQLTPFEVRGLDMNTFRLDLKDLEDDSDGMAFLRTHRHNTEIVLSGITYSRFIEIINGYTVEFEDGTYGVSITGANNNILDVKVPNQVSVLTNNSAGLVVVTGALAADDIANAVWDELSSDHLSSGTTGKLISDLQKAINTIKTLTYTQLK